MLLVAIWLVLSACNSDSSPSNADRDPYLSVAQIRGPVCGKQLLGSAVVVGQDLLITAAHNIAGSQGGLAASFEDRVNGPVAVIAIDPDRDIALLYAPGVDRPRLPTAAPLLGSSGRIIRLRGEGERAEAVFTNAEPVENIGRDIYDQPTEVTRDNVRVQASAGAGFSGAPMLDENDFMIGLVWARAREDGQMYGLSGPEIDAFVEHGRPQGNPVPISTGPCPP